MSGLEVKKLFEERLGVNLCDLGIGIFLIWCQRHKLQEKIQIYEYHQRKFLSCVSMKIMKWNNNSGNGRKQLQIIYLTKVLFPEYIKISCNSPIKVQIIQLMIDFFKQIIQFKKRQRNAIKNMKCVCGGDKNVL